jgi:hypothetical protein
MQTFMPLNTESIQQLSEDEIEHIDQYLFRFAKLQDMIGVKLFSSVLSFLGEDVGNLSFIDLFNRLEQIGVVQDYDKWIKLRLARNEVSHEYEDEPGENATNINKIYLLKDDLIKYLDDIKNYLVSFKELE